MTASSRKVTHAAQQTTSTRRTCPHIQKSDTTVISGKSVWLDDADLSQISMRGYHPKAPGAWFELNVHTVPTSATVIQWVAKVSYEIPFRPVQVLPSRSTGAWNLTDTPTSEQYTTCSNTWQIITEYLASSLEAAGPTIKAQLYSYLGSEAKATVVVEPHVSAEPDSPKKNDL
ncbi:hypothetical protein LIA77_04221 [Sarocladium implicatum]|nr:hypothetical protein LIA77_04221 [Sarocladium implicatum]